MLENLKAVARSLGIRRRRPRPPLKFDRALNEVTQRGTDPFSKLFYDYSGTRLIHKWDHYLPVYSRLFERYRDRKTPVRFLEIGVSKGGSLELWRSYFGPRAIIFGIDIDPKCAVFNGPKSQVRIGSQADPKFLVDVVAEMGGADIILDDGSHVASHQRISFDALFPLLADDGLYVVEDLHTAYWQSYEGGFRRKGTFIEFSKSLVDDMHRWYSGRHSWHSAAEKISSIQFFDSIVAFEKKQKIEQPFNVMVGPGKNA